MPHSEGAVCHLTDKGERPGRNVYMKTLASEEMPELAEYLTDLRCPEPLHCPVVGGDRLQILSPEEYELLWGFPRFVQSDRDLFFTLTAPEREALEKRRSVRTKSHFLLHLGYFRARQRFFRLPGPVLQAQADGP